MLSHRNAWFFLLISSLAILVGYGVYLDWAEHKKYSNLVMVHQPPMNKVLSDRSITEFIPPEWPEGTIYWFDPQRDARFQGISPFTRHLYGVRIDSTTGPLKVDGVPAPDVVGFMAYPGIDEEVNYYKDERNIVQYDPANALHSGGDILFLFQK